MKIETKKVVLTAALVIISVIAGFGVGGYLGMKGGFAAGQALDQGPSDLQPDYEKIKSSHFGVGAGDYVEMMPDLGAHWARFPLDVDSLGSDPERIDWTKIDERVVKANDEKVLLYGSFNRGGRSAEQAWPKAEIFASYFEKIVERYDGDGVDDMPGLKYPIKNWEILNEVPSLPNQDATPEIYADYLKEGYKALKEACNDCRLANGGIPGPIAQEFLEDTISYDPGVKDYFDILSWHTYSPPFKEGRLGFLDGWEGRMGLDEKEIWYPELGIYTTPDDEQARAGGLIKSYVYRFSKGTVVGIYVEVGPHGKEGSGDGLINGAGEKLPSYYAYKTLASKIDYFTGVETIKEEWESKGDFEELKVGHYKFVVDGESVYVLWGGVMPAEISGQVKITDAGGATIIVDASEVNLGASPIFLEV